MKNLSFLHLNKKTIQTLEAPLKKKLRCRKRISTDANNFSTSINVLKLKKGETKKKKENKTKKWKIKIRSPYL